MELATGETELRDGDYFGTVLNRAARVMAAGHGGQILVADSTAGLLSGVDLLDLGPRRLRDVPIPITVFQLQEPGLRTEFPPLRTLDSTPGNLRRPASSLVGRDAEVGQIEEALRARRLVTLTGVGGVGKTRLALEVASNLVDEFPDGVWVFELAAVADPAAIPDAVAAVLGVTQQPGKSVGESVASALEGRSRLLVFDNCEHVVESVADLVEAILAASTTVKVLATSREGIGVADEQLWRVPSLDVGAAVELFVERAQSVTSGLLLNETSAIEDVCRRLDGIPLAIELAASRMASMTAAEVRDRLDDRFKLLVGARRGLERHQTLRQAVAWSYDLLDDAEKALLTRCSVFSGGFGLQSARAVSESAEIDEYVVLDLLDALVRKSLLVADRSSGLTRFSMLETIRQFAHERLVDRGEATEARTAHARYFAGREDDVLALWDSPNQRDAYEWFMTELANLRIAFRWAADQDDLGTAATIASYANFLGNRVDVYETIGWAEELIETAKTVSHPRLAQLYVAAAQCYAIGRIEDAVGYADASQLAIASGRFDQVRSEFEAGLVGAYLWAGLAQRWLESSRASVAQSPTSHAQGRSNHVFALLMAGRRDEAMSACEGALAAAEATGNPTVVCLALNAYGMAHFDADPPAAYEALRRGLTIAEDTGNRQVESTLVVTLARLAAVRGDPTDALEFLARAIKSTYNSGSFSFMTTPLAALASLLDRLDYLQPAATIAGFAAVPLTVILTPEFANAVEHVREVLHPDTYESFARAGKNMTPAAMAAYALKQIEHARAELNAVSE
jgi:predicted ATPase